MDERERVLAINRRRLLQWDALGTAADFLGPVLAACGESVATSGTTAVAPRTLAVEG